VGYALGVDLGTTYTAAATFRDGRVEIANLGNRAAAVPSVVLLREDETVLTGEAADRRGLSEPERVAREFKRRLGDTTPIFVGGTPYSAEALMARLLRAVVDEVVTREGGLPDSVAVCHPANWGPFKTDLLSQAVRLAEMPGATLLTEPEAAALHYASTERVEVGQIIAVYDLGGGTFDAAVLKKTATGFEVLGEPEGIERLGGVDFDAAVFAHVVRSLDGAFEQLDEDDPASLAAVARLRQECVEAKEALSTDTDVSIPVLLPTLQTEVRLTRTEFEAMVRPALSDSIDALRRAMRSAKVEPADLEAVVLIGGSSRIPLVSQLVSGEVGRPVAIDTHPKHAVALGAARRAAIDAGLEGAGTLASEEPASPDADAGWSTAPAVAAGAAAGAAAALVSQPEPAAAAPPAAAPSPPQATPAPASTPPMAAPPAAEAPVSAVVPPLPYPTQATPQADLTPPPVGPATQAQRIVVPPQTPAQPPQHPYGGAASSPDPKPGKAKKAKKKAKTPVGVILVGLLVILGLGAGIAFFINESLKDDGDAAAGDPDTGEVQIAEEEVPAGEPCTDGDFDLLACIDEVTVREDGQLVASFTTFGFTPEDTTSPETNHVHFFLTDSETGEFNQVTGGLPGGDPSNWIVWIVPDDFDQLSLQQAQDFGADALCIVVATFDHQSIPGTGNCVPVPTG